MKKEYQKWHKIKTYLHKKKSKVFFHEREIWWCALGLNIGFEQDGSGEYFRRPVIILRRYHKGACLIVPLTTRNKKGLYYFSVGLIGDKQAIATLSQIRFVDQKRMIRKIGTLNKDIFSGLVQTTIRVNFPEK